MSQDPVERVGDADRLADRIGDDVGEADVVRHEERLRVERRTQEVGTARIRKVVEHERFDDEVLRGVEHAEIEVVPPLEDDSGEIEHQADGSVSIPVFEERLVVEKRLVVRERVLIRKRVVQEAERVTADLMREVAEVDVDPSAQDRVHVAERPLD